MRSAIREEECTVSRDVTRDEGDVILLGGGGGRLWAREVRRNFKEEIMFEFVPQGLREIEFNH